MRGARDQSKRPACKVRVGGLVGKASPSERLEWIEGESHLIGPTLPDIKLYPITFKRVAISGVGPIVLSFATANGSTACKYKESASIAPQDGHVARWNQKVRKWVWGLRGNSDSAKTAGVALAAS